MGCDIHWVLETQAEDNSWVGIYSTSTTPQPAGRIGGWFDLSNDTDFSPESQYIHPTMIGRNYRWFAQLAGVRGEGPEPKGVPADASDLAKMDIADWNGDGHSHSWCTAKEFIIAWLNEGEKLDAIKHRFIGDNNNKFKYSYLLGLGDKNLDQYRVVYWFDN